MALIWTLSLFSDGGRFFSLAYVPAVNCRCCLTAAPSTSCLNYSNRSLIYWNLLSTLNTTSPIYLYITWWLVEKKRFLAFNHMQKATKSSRKTDSYTSIYNPRSLFYPPWYLYTPPWKIRLNIIPNHISYRKRQMFFMAKELSPFEDEFIAFSIVTRLMDGFILILSIDVIIN